MSVVYLRFGMLIGGVDKKDIFLVYTGNLSACWVFNIERKGLKEVGHNKGYRCGVTTEVGCDTNE